MAQTSASPPIELQVLPDDTPDDRKQAQRELSAIIRSMPVDPLGCFACGKDGVMRSLTADCKVIGTVPLEPRLIKADLDRDDYDQEAEAHFRGVDGTKVPQEQWFHPPADILPPPVPDDIVEESKRMMEERGLSWDVQSGEEWVKGGETPSCPVIVRSDHDTLT